MILKIIICIVKIARWVKRLASEPANQSWDLAVLLVEESNLLLYSDLHTRTVAPMQIHHHPHRHK